MVVLAGAICTKNGKALLSRQFVELSKVRIEGLLAAFPKLMGTGKQHTFIDTESVRYIYQPLESLYILLLTNKSSNILEDLETLHLLAKVVPEYCHQLEETEITKNAFDLIFAFDEVIALGYKERVTLQQIKHFTTMESHEEERARIEEEVKKAHAKREMLKKMGEISKKKDDDRRSGGDGYSGMGGGSSQSSSRDHVYVEPRSPVIEDTRASSSVKEPARAPIKGMSLGGKTSKKSDVAKVLKEEKIVEREEEAEALVEAPTSHSGAFTPQASQPTENVHVVIEEQVNITVENDGGLQNLEIKGGLSVTCLDPNVSKVKVMITQGENRAFQLKTHPNIDKQAFSSGELKLKDSSRGFPAGAPASILKWRAQTKEETMLPINISCWPSQGSEGQTVVNMEYELRAPFDLHNVSVGIPIPQNIQPVVSSVDGSYEFNSREKVLYWKHPIIDQSNKEGAMEFHTGKADPRSFFPLQISFSANNTYCDIQLVDVLSVDSGKPVKHSHSTQLSVEKFEIV
eukprot:TRINITY_DN2713_c0_g1_i1.p1 TRINITY_DN2713_c0_g1~~TRINITY_DN2713_c0_g1_i1.p1  ORF type:complete len:516 (+),score=127.75 TRINITY_DN2713_c0_g1_i1:182-1729(+)